MAEADEDKTPDEAGEAEASDEPKAEAKTDEAPSKEDKKADAAAEKKASLRAAIKAQIIKLKEKRQAALEAKDSKELKRTRHNIKRLKHKMRRST